MVVIHPLRKCVHSLYICIHMAHIKALKTLVCFCLHWGNLWVNATTWQHSF